MGRVMGVKIATEGGGDVQETWGSRRIGPR